MATQRNNPYGAFNFLVSLGDGDEASVIAGFSDVSGLGTEINYSEYRNGNDLVNTVRKVANTFKQEDVTLKRGLIGSTDLFQWVKDVREGADRRRTVTITLLDEARKPVAAFRMPVENRMPIRRKTGVL